MSNKAIFLGPAVLDIRFKGNIPVDATPGGILIRSAALLPEAGMTAVYVSEAGVDRPGDAIVGYLSQRGVDVSSVDRFTDGKTPVRLTYDGDYMTAVTYTAPPAEPVNPVWPRINPGDYVVFGSPAAIDERWHKLLVDFLRYAADRKAVIIYVAALSPKSCPRVTRVMPRIYEWLEMCDIFVTDPLTLSTIFKTSDAAAAFRDHIEFHCPTMVHIDSASRTTTLFHGHTVLSATAPVGSSAPERALSGFVCALATAGIDRSNVRSIASRDAATVTSIIFSDSKI